jgi:hypothetical protein
MIRADMPSTSSLLRTAALCLAVGIGAAILVGSLVSLVASRPAQATAAYAAQTGLPCGRCHVNPAGGGANTAFGKAFAANGHKVPSKKH